MAYMNLSYTHIISYTQYAVHSIIMYTMLNREFRFCLYCIFFFLHLCYYYLIFKAASLEGHMAFLVAVHYVIF